MLYSRTVSPSSRSASAQPTYRSWTENSGPGWTISHLIAAALLMLPSSSIFPAADLAADRRMYLALFPLAAAAALLLSRIRNRAIAPIFIAVLVVVSFGRTQVWASDESLWREAVLRAPDKVRPRIQLSRSVGTEEALALLAEARRMAPDDATVAAETGRVLLAAGR